jgi:hypothetical protein
MHFCCILVCVLFCLSVTACQPKSPEALPEDVSPQTRPEQAADTRPVLPAAAIEQAMRFSAPYWHFQLGKRSHRLNHTFGFYTLCLEAYLEQQQGPVPESWLVGAITGRLLPVLTGGTEPECQGGLGGWSHGAFAWSLAYIRHTPAVWDALSEQQHTRADLLMEALAVAACFTLDDDNDYHALLDGTRNFSKDWNPNHIEGYVGVGMAAAWYFGAEELDLRFKNFDFDSFIAELQEMGYTNIVGCWTASPGTKQALMEGGVYQGENPNLDYGSGAGVCGNTFTYQDMSLDQCWEIYEVLASRMYARTARSEIRVTNKKRMFTHIVTRDDAGDFLISPYDGQYGMCLEFDTHNAITNHTPFRSSLHYVYEGWMNNMATATAVWARGEWNPVGGKDRPLMNAIEVGSEDFLFKAQYGYSGFANGEVEVNTLADFVDKPRGWTFVLTWWESVVKPLVHERDIRDNSQ